MIKTFLLLTAILLPSAAIHGQAGSRVFDNFDRAQGVSVYREPEPVRPAPKKFRRGKNGKLYEVTANDQLVKRTVQSRPVMSVGEGMASREGNLGRSTTKFMMGSNASLKGFTTGNDLHDSLIVESSRRYNIDPLLIYSQMHQESSFKTTARSYKGASGLMQLMPATARRFGVTKIYDPRQNIDAGVRYMRWLLDTFNGDVNLALAGYNAGEGAVMRYGWTIPPYRETQEYVRRISTRYSMISNGSYVAGTTQATTAKLQQKESRPLYVYEPTPLTVRTADGRMMLMNQ